MADNQVPQTEIAQHLERIETAKIILGNKAQEMVLLYDGDSISKGDTIDVIADAFDDIHVTTKDDIQVVGHTVKFPKGYIPTAYSASVTTVEKAAPNIYVNTDTGDITAHVTQPEGYVSGDDKTTTQNISELASQSLLPEHIRQGTKVFGVEGTFTSDAFIVTNGTNADGDYTSIELEKGRVVYANGDKVVGALQVHPDTPVYFNPLTVDEIDLGVMKYTGQKVKLAFDPTISTVDNVLLARLKKI